jgi:hypothetical protein
MIEINHFKVFIMYSDDVADDVDHLYVKRIHLVGFSYIVIEDVISCFWNTMVVAILDFPKKISK